MKVSTRGRYALRLMIELASHQPDDYVTLKEIALRQEISQKYLEQIISPLTRAGLVRAGRGSHGGYRLTRRPEEYTAGDVLRAVEGSLAPISCLEEEPNTCPRAAQCRSLPFWQGLEQVINNYVDSVTLEDLRQQNLQEPDYII